MCIDIVKICLGIAHGQISSIFDGVICPRHHNGRVLSFHVLLLGAVLLLDIAGLGGSVGCAVRLETRRSRVQPSPRSATFFRGD